MVDPIPLNKDEKNATYQPENARQFHIALLQANKVFTTFRSRFIGKCSPVHFFCGRFDIAVTRFSGRTAPKHPGGIPNLPDWVTQEAYSHEVSSVGFWPGNEMNPFAAFYNYMYPEPEGFENLSINPDQAYFDDNLKEFLLPYEEVGKSPNPEQMLIDFLQSTYQGGADLAQWDREALEQDKSST